MYMFIQQANIAFRLKMYYGSPLHITDKHVDLLGMFSNPAGNT